jgi:signal transduction histidine kinase/ActR/RegA family two-component response regulator
MAYHKTLERQLERFLPDNTDWEKLVPLFQVISHYYESQERDKQLSEHAFSVSEKEYQEVLHNLKEQDEIKRQSIEKLRGVLQLLDQRLGIGPACDDDLMSVVNDLKLQVEHSRKLKADLQRAKEAAENLAKAKGNFLSVMSHEIRTPLNAIIGNIHLLENEDHLPMQEPLINSLRISSTNLLSLVNDILDFSKIDEGKVVFAENKISLGSLITNLKEVHNYRARENQNEIQITIDPELPAFVLGDETRLSQVMNNLIANAIKFTHHGVIGVSAQVLNRYSSRAMIRFMVTDTGIGIDKEKQELIFERFTQANSEIDRKYGGSGLGLAIVKKLLELWGSKICIESEPGKGSEFYFDMEFQRCEAPVVPSLKKSETDLRGLKVLLVEDTEFNVQMAQRMLTNWKASVDVARNGEVAVAMCRANSYDIILMDIQMPVMDGITASKQIRTFNSTVPIIALSASNSNEIFGDVVAAGMSDSVSKPFNPNDLFKMLLKWADEQTKITS